MAVGNSCDFWLKDRKRGQYKLRTMWPAIKKSNCYLEKQVPDIFINLWYEPLMGDAKRIGFLRFEYDLKKAKELVTLAIGSLSIHSAIFRPRTRSSGIRW